MDSCTLQFCRQELHSMSEIRWKKRNEKKYNNILIMLWFVISWFLSRYDTHWRDVTRFYRSLWLPAVFRLCKIRLGPGRLSSIIHLHSENSMRCLFRFRILRIGLFRAIFFWRSAELHEEDGYSPLFSDLSVTTNPLDCLFYNVFIVFFQATRNIRHCWHTKHSTAQAHTHTKKRQTNMGRYEVRHGLWNVVFRIPPYYYYYY